MERRSTIYGAMNDKLDEKSAQEKNENVYDDMLAHNTELLKSVRVKETLVQNDDAEAIFFEEDKEENSFSSSEREDKLSLLIENLANCEKKYRWLLCLAIFLIIVSLAEAIGFIFLSKNNRDRIDVANSLIKKVILEENHFRDQWKFHEENLQKKHEILSEQFYSISEKITYLKQLISDQLALKDSLSKEKESLSIERDKFQIIAVRQRLELILMRYFFNGDKECLLDEMNRIESELTYNKTSESGELKLLIADKRRKLAENSLLNVQKTTALLDKIETSILSIPFPSSGKLKLGATVLQGLYPGYVSGAVATNDNNVDQRKISESKNIQRKEAVNNNWQTKSQVFSPKIGEKMFKELICRIKKIFTEAIDIKRLDIPSSEEIFLSLNQRMMFRDILHLHFTKARLSMLLQNKFLLDLELKKIINLIKQHFNSEIPEIASIIKEIDSIPNNLLEENLLREKLSH